MPRPGKTSNRLRSSRQLGLAPYAPSNSARITRSKSFAPIRVSYTKDSCSATFDYSSSDDVSCSLKNVCLQSSNDDRRRSDSFVDCLEKEMSEDSMKTAVTIMTHSTFDSNGSLCNVSLKSNRHKARRQDGNKNTRSKKGYMRIPNNRINTLKGPDRIVLPLTLGSNDMFEERSVNSDVCVENDERPLRRMDSGAETPHNIINKGMLLKSFFMPLFILTISIVLIQKIFKAINSGGNAVGDVIDLELESARQNQNESKNVYDTKWEKWMIDKACKKNTTELDMEVCQRMCLGKQCCFVSEDDNLNCRVTKSKGCDFFSACEVLYPKKTTTSEFHYRINPQLVKKVVSEACNDEIFFYQEKLERCRNLCRTRMCCFDALDVVSCKREKKEECVVFHACEVLISR